MNLDYIHKVNEYGDNIVRLYNFDRSQAIKFRDAIKQSIIEKREPLEVYKLDFVEARNCLLVLRIADEDEGITTTSNVMFYCDLTIEGYQRVLKLLEPFCNRETKGYQWLYDIDSSTDFLFSPGGTW